MIAQSTIFTTRRYIDTMNDDTTYSTKPGVGCLLEKAHQLMTSDLSKVLAEAGIDITVPEYLILRALYAEDRLQQCEIADRLSKDRASVCRTIRSLERKQLVRTETISYKCQRVSLTDRSRQLESPISAVATICHDHLLEALSDQGVAQLERLLTTIVTNYNLQ